MTLKVENNLASGIMSIALIVMWINFIPLYGLALPLMNINSNFYPQLFIIAHICGLLGGSYYLACQRSASLPRIVNTLSPAILALLTIILVINTGIYNRIVLAIVFTCFGLLSGWIVSRWMAWFLSDLTAGRRGSVFSKSLAVTYILISLSTLVLTSFPDGLLYALFISALIVMVGGQLTNSLQITGKPSQTLIRKELRSIIPPIPLIFFALIGYSVVALTYKLIISWGLKEPVLPWLLIIPYALIGLLFGSYSDRAGRYIFFILAFLCTGLGFLTLIIATDQPMLQILTGLLINSGLLFIHLYYWLSLADYQNPQFSPLSMAIGVSIELAIFSLSYIIVDFVTYKPDPSFINLGLTGVALILIGFAVIAGISVHSFSRLNNFEKPSLLFTNGFKADMGKNSPASEAYYFALMGKDNYKDVVVNKFKLSKKEAEIAYKISIGYSNNDIINELHISANTIKYHLKNIYAKLSVTNREEAKKKLANSLKSEFPHPVLHNHLEDQGY